MKLLITLSLCVITFLGLAQKKPLIVKAAGFTASLRVDQEYYKDAWTISPKVKPDVQTIPVHKQPVSVSFVTDMDSVHFLVEGGKDYDFIVVVNGTDSAYTRIKGELFTNPAHFTKQYAAANNNKTAVEIPEIYELINILYAITPTGKTDPDVVYKNGDYYKDVMAWFDKYNTEPVVAIIDSLLKAGKYPHVKMDAYAFNFTTKNQVIKSAVYDRVSWGSTNTLAPFIKEVERFARESDFRRFFQLHSPLYRQQVAVYRDSLNTKAMQAWLNKNFPGTRYNAFKIIFSPLVAYNQSAVWLEDNGFKEAQAHVNYPYPEDFANLDLSEKAIHVMRGNIVFTELNHAFINPEAEKPVYEARLRKAFADINKWIEKDKPAGNYANVYACFEEYMNWVLVSLRYVDEAPAAELEQLLARNERNITTRRGFRRFTEFNKYIVGIYRDRKPGQTVADLYPQIVDWCIKQ
ncbi:MAG: DUF4932 domain-containing protein [Chitinophagaceae bacterium]